MLRLRRELSFSHLLELSRVTDPVVRAFYEVQTLRDRWSVRELRRQRDAMLYDRVGLSRDLATDLPDTSGFSESNLKRMVQCFQAYPAIGSLQHGAPAALTVGAQAAPQPVREAVAAIGARPVPYSPEPPDPAQLCAQLSLQVPWGHIILLFHMSPRESRGDAPLREFMVKGFVLDDERLELLQPPAAGRRPHQCA